MALEVGSVFTKLEARVDDAGFRRFERQLDRAQQSARRGAEADLKADVDDRGFKKYNRELDRADRNTTKASAGMRGSFGLLRVGIAGFGAAGVTAAGLLGKTFLSTAADIGESVSKLNTILGKDATKTITDFAATSAKEFGLSKAAALEAAGGFAGMFDLMGKSAPEAANMSVKMTKLAADMASFNNSTPEEALTALQSGLRGEAEPLRRFNVLLDDATLRQQAVKDGLIATTKDALTPQQKAMAAYGVIMKQTATQQGDFERTSKGLPNQLRVMKASFSDLGASIGAKLLPAATAAATGINNLMGSLSKGGGAGGALTRVRGAFEAVKSSAQSVFRFVGRIIDDNADTFRSMGRTIQTNVGLVVRLFGGIKRAAGEVFGASSGTGRDIRTFIRAFLDIADAAMKVASAITKRALPGIITAFRGFFTIVRGVIRLITGILTGDFGKAWDGVKDIFKGAIKIVGGLLRAATAPFRSAAAGIGRAIGGAFSSAWKAITGTARGFVNGIIDVINIIPGVNIKHVGGGKPKGDATVGGPGGSNTVPRADRQALAEGGKVTMPIAIMGEEAPQHPEWVIPTNPAYRPRAVGLWIQAARELGIPGFLLGGKFNPGDALDFVTGLPGKAVNSAKGLAGKLLGKLPGNPGGILHGAFGYALDRAKDFITDKAGDVWGAAKDFIGFGKGAKGEPASGGKIPLGSGTGRLAAMLANKFKVGITDGWRPANVGYGAPNSSHKKGTPANPGAHDFGTTSRAAQAYAYSLGAKWADIHRYVNGQVVYDGGPGTHLHVSWFAKGGKKTRPKPTLSKADDKGIKRSVARGESGIRGFETRIQRAEREYGQMDRKFGLDDEVVLIEHDDGSATIDNAALGERLKELSKLMQKREEIRQLILAYRRAIGRLIRSITAAVVKLKKALAAAKGKGRQKERGGYREAIGTYTTRLGELRGTHGDLELDVEDARIDLAELNNEYTALAGTTGKAAPAADGDPGSGSGDPAAAGEAAAAAPSATEVAAAAIAQFQAFQEERAGLYAGFGANFMRTGGRLASIGEQAAGARYFGAFGAAGGAGGQDVGPTITINNTFAGGPPDAHTWTQQQRFEVEGAMG